MAVYCPNCGKRLPDDAVFCDDCGTKIHGEQAAESVREVRKTNPSPVRKGNTPAPKKSSGGFFRFLLILILAALTAVAGLLLVFRPWESANILTVLLGISLLSEGILNLCVAVSTVKIVKHQYPDVIDADFIPIDREDSNE